MIVQDVLPLTKRQDHIATIRPALNADDSAPVSPSDDSDPAKRLRAWAAVGHARVANAWLRLGASAIVALVATSVVGSLWPLYWLAGLAIVIVVDRRIFQSVYKSAKAGEAPKRGTALLTWMVAQSAYGNIVAGMLWFAPYVPGQTLAVLYLCGGFANAIATLRASATLSVAGAAPTMAVLLGLPIWDYVAGGASNPHLLMPLVGGLLLIGFGVNLWRGLRASDAAHAEAEAAAIRERQAAAAAAAAKTDMIRRMNDELRTPMAALIGAAEHLRRAAATPAARTHIATLAHAGEVLKLVLDDLSDLDRLENGKLPIEAKPASPREIVREVVSAFRAAAHDKQLELFLDVAPETPAFVELDALRVRQILFNLLANAVRYTTHGGVRVRVEPQAGAEAGFVRLMFSVADTGAGMSRSQLALVFGRERVCGEGIGPGLGLAISLRLARLMGGRLHAKSELGEGSIFAFTVDAPIVQRVENTAA